MERFCIRLVTLIFTLFLGTPLFALTTVNLSDDDLARKADLIVIGTVLSAYSERDSVNGEIFTYVSIRVDDHLKGTNRSRDLVLKLFGGTLNGEFLYIPGAADFYRNEEVMLFLERRGDGSLSPMGMALGKYSIYRDAQTGQKIVLRDGDGNGRYFSNPRSDIADVEAGERVLLNEFRTRIQRIANEGRSK